MIAEIAIKQFKEKSWSYVGDIKYLADCNSFFTLHALRQNQYLSHPMEVLKKREALITFTL
jgi:hypothetical protein